MVQALIQFWGLNMFKIEHDIQTGEINEIELTAAEIKAIEKLQKEHAVKLKINEEKAAQRQAILDRLGLTSEEASLLLS
jgi:Asp-tRNA(Asn)/Glu-tRNA(Gln) amidotransferase A subunit family amidase